MRPVLHPSLVNGRGGDPLLYVDVMFERRALLFDMGELSALPPRKLLRISDVFVSHAHMDHFIGFDRWLRVLVGRGRRVRLFGPEGFIDRVGARLAGYSWNLVQNYAEDLVLDVHEVRGGGAGRRACFRCRNRFCREREGAVRFDGGVLRDEPMLQVRCTVLDHGIPCLGFRLQESRHVNVWKDRLAAMGLATGPWLRELKRAVLAGAPDDTPVSAPERSGNGTRALTLGELRGRILKIAPGMALAWVVDSAWTPGNVARITELAAGVDVLYIESVFLEADAARGRERAHLTARQAGEIARRAGAGRIEPMHFSPRYGPETARLEREARAAFGECPDREQGAAG